MKQLYNIKLINTGSGQEVYNENLPFNDEPIIDDIKAFIKLIQPTLKYDYVDYSFVGCLNEIGRLIKN